MPSVSNPEAALARSRALAAAAAAEARQDWVAAASGYSLAARWDPEDHQLLANAGNALWLADQPRLALDPYRRAAQLAPADAVVYRGLGNVYTDLQAFEAADRAYGLSWSLDPQPATAWNHSQVLIGLERYKEGYAMAEARWDLPAHEHYRDQSTAWGGDLEGLKRPLRVWSEQGLGDTLQHLRWLGTLVARRSPQAPAVVVEVETCLVELLREGLGHLAPALEVEDKRAVPEPSDPGGHVSLLSLPHLLGGAPWPQQGCQLQSSRWPRPRPLGRAPSRIGLVWAAGRKLDDPVTAREYRRRSLDEALLGGLIVGLSQRGIQCVLLQFGDDRDRADPWRQLVSETLPEGADFKATAAVVADLDLVISVDTAMAHLVGAMGRPGWVLLPFSSAPRWLRHRPDSPWYPSLRLFRQPAPGDGQGLVGLVLEALDQMLGHPGSPT